jgi:hypothetical protein
MSGGVGGIEVKQLKSVPHRPSQILSLRIHRRRGRIEPTAEWITANCPTDGATDEVRKASWSHASNSPCRARAGNARTARPTKKDATKAHCADLFGRAARDADHGRTKA